MNPSQSLEIVELVPPKRPIPNTPTCTNDFSPKQLEAFLKKCAAKVKSK